LIFTLSTVSAWSFRWPGRESLLSIGAWRSAAPPAIGEPHLATRNAQPIGWRNIATVHDKLGRLVAGGARSGEDAMARSNRVTKPPRILTNPVPQRTKDGWLHE
jgi:hypothetical protein